MSICGPSLPEVGSRIPLRRLLHDNGFGRCDLMVKGLYGNRAQGWVCHASFAAYPNAHVWRPTELSPKSLGWVERQLRGWDQIWPDAEWAVILCWPWQSERWERRKPKYWVVTKTGQGES